MKNRNSIKSPDSSDWDHYWKLQARGQKTYGYIANIYRRYIIKGTLNHYVAKYFDINSLLLHAGSGSGEVDLDVCESMEIVAIDFSSHALSTYSEGHRIPSNLAQADIFRLPFPDETFDGVFNLGVMEHFNDIEMVNALIELRRVIKNDGVILLFWPPKWGLSVFVLKTVHWISIMLNVGNIVQYLNLILLENLNLDYVRRLDLCNPIFGSYLKFKSFILIKLTFV